MTEAQKAEAEKTTVSVEFEGHTYEVEPTDLTWDTLEALAEGLTDSSLIMFLKTFLGDEQYGSFKERHPEPLTRAENGDVINVPYSMRVAIMVALGNSEASSGS